MAAIITNAIVTAWMLNSYKPLPHWPFEFSFFPQLALITSNITMAEPVKTTSTHSGELPIGKDGKPLKPCCACPETKKARDECIFKNGEENCQELIQAHLTCMRNLGFKI